MGSIESRSSVLVTNCDASSVIESRESVPLNLPIGVRVVERISAWFIVFLLNFFFDDI